MQKLKAFNMTELMLVMMILGVILVLTLPLAMNIKDDDKIYAAYKGKAIKDVVDASEYALLKNRAKGFGNINIKPDGACPAGECDGDGYFLPNFALRKFFESAIAYKSECYQTDCLARNTGTIPGVKIQNGSVITFRYVPGCGGVPAETVFDCGAIYIDMNGDKKPNETNKDAYVFRIYQDRVVLDPYYHNQAEGTD